MSQIKGQDKTQEKKNKQSRDSQPSRKIIQTNDSEDDPGSQKKNGQDARNVYQRNFSSMEKQKDKTYKNKCKTINKMVIGSYLSIITLNVNVNGLNALTKRKTGWVYKNRYMYALPPTTSLYLISKLYVIILYF